MSSADFFHTLTFQNLLQEHFQTVANDLDQERRFVDSNEGPICLQRLSADSNSRRCKERFNKT